MTKSFDLTGKTGAVQALWYRGREVCGLDPVSVERPKCGEVLVRTRFSCISRGTEGLIFRGAVPESEWQRMRAPFQAGEFPFPVKYGYANVGTVVEGEADLVGQTVFSLFPHQSLFSLPSHACVPIPAGLPPERAVLAANMETALNSIWDGKPSPGDHICVVGGGVVGLLTAYLAARMPATHVTLVDVNPARAAIAKALGLAFALPREAPCNQDLVFHASARAEGLSTSLSCAGDGASVIEMSWYGTQDVTVPLGADFHSRRLKLVSSQVGTIPFERQPRWTFKRRLTTALDLLQDPALDHLITHRLPFQALPERLPEVLTRDADVLAALVVYDDPSSPAA